ncbi:kyphoscoliosis peptidase-like [Ptychodera flava]|uniref:kyphoscoliosis peptidase-like n=1 Tax=Ptychodera flava TaxID=63121 RepID=UPI00396A55B4
MGCGSSRDATVTDVDDAVAEAGLPEIQQKEDGLRRRIEKKKKPPFLNIADTFWEGKRKLMPSNDIVTTLDTYAINAPAFLKDDHRKLVAYLIQLAKSDTERARVIFRWIIENVSYDMESYLSGNLANTEVTPEGIIRTGKAVCQGYANLFQYMCKLAGIECEVLAGASKGLSFKPGHVFKTGSDGLPDLGDDPTLHAWNKVKLNGDWYLCDATWADLEYNASQRTDERLARGLQESDFLAEPVAFLSTHFPFEDGISLVYEQYVENPISDINRWANQMTRHSGFFTFQMSLLSADKCVIEADEDNHTTLHLRSPHPMRFWGDLSKVADGKEIGKNYSMIHSVFDVVSVEVFLPRAGEYMFSLCATPTNADEQLSGGHNVIECKIIGRSTKVNKALPKTQGWGQSWEFFEADYEVLDQDSPIITTDDGLKTLAVALPAQFQYDDISYTLRHESNEKITESGYIYAERSDARTATFHFKLPQVGDYTFNIYLKSNDGNLISRAAYLIRSLKGVEPDTAFFPDGNRRLWGPSEDFFNMGINFTGELSSTLTAPEGRCSLALKCENVKFSRSLIKYGSTTSSKESARMIFADKNTLESLSIFYIRIPDKNYYSLQLFAAKAGQTTYAFVGRWLIDVVSPYTGELYPSHQGNWGPSEKFEELGLQIDGNPSSYFKASAGSCDIFIRNAQNIERWCHLKRDSQDYHASVYTKRPT